MSRLNSICVMLYTALSVMLIQASIMKAAVAAVNALAVKPTEDDF